MKLEITEQQLNLIEQQQLNEIAWIKSVSSHISQLDIPLTPSFVNYIWGKKQVKSFHVSDVENIDNIKSIIGKRKSISTFKYMNKDLLNKMNGVQTEGGIIYEIVGDLLFEGPRDMMSSPDATGRRWIPIYVFPKSIREEMGLDEESEYDSTNDFDVQTIGRYYRKMDNIIKRNAKKIREFFTNFNNHSEQGGMWNETIVHNVHVNDILWREDIVDFLETWETKEQKIQVIDEIGQKLNSIASGEVYLADNQGRFGLFKIKPSKWVEERGGFSNYKKYKKKEHINPEPTTISIN